VDTIRIPKKRKELVPAMNFLVVVAIVAAAAADWAPSYS